MLHRVKRWNRRRWVAVATVVAATAGAAVAAAISGNRSLHPSNPGSAMPPRAFFGFLGGSCNPDSPREKVGVPKSKEVIGSGLRGDGAKARGKKTTAWEVLDVAEVAGKTALVTGANSGIGYYTALTLAYGGADVLLGCRNKEKGLQAKQSIEEALKEDGQPVPKLEVVEIDLESLSSIKQFTEKFKSEGKPLQLLCLNAGVMAIPEYTESKDGLEMQFATNHLGHFALTRALQDVLVASAPARVVTLASEAHRGPAFDFDDFPPSSQKYSDWRAYQQSKLANILFTRELSRRLAEATGSSEAVTSNAVHPGVIATPLGRQQFLKGSVLLNLLQDRDEVQGAASSVYCLSAKDLQKTSGEYFRDCRQAETTRFASNKEDAKKLWELSENLLVEKGFWDKASESESES
eukprot:TRINITY_DN15218_c5_g1_i1.p1 TRINITY_DN15218_c5_g1~~TRINITY_DN15218_c5_g1_i1.p1  ORF type:complete len:407 (+),score=101.33 TRINITY_DN15218_c5_g1_i1:39-1259(+)